MILEHALLSVRPGTAEQFVQSFAEARGIIEAMPGCRTVSLSRCLERRDAFLLLVEWDTVEDHTVGFRGSPEYRRWRELLHHYYEPFPVVEHYAPVPRRGH